MPLRTRLIRVVAIEIHLYRAAMRLELYGCVANWRSHSDSFCVDEDMDRIGNSPIATRFHLHLFACGRAISFAGKPSKIRHAVSGCRKVQRPSSSFKFCVVPAGIVLHISLWCHDFFACLNKNRSKLSEMVFLCQILLGIWTYNSFLYWISFYYRCM